MAREKPPAPSTSAQSSSSSTSSKRRGPGRPRAIEKSKKDIKALMSLKSSLTTAATGFSSSDLNGEDEDDEKEWNVDSITKARLIPVQERTGEEYEAHNWEYQVQWSDVGDIRYPTPTWEPTANISVGGVHEYWARKYAGAELSTETIHGEVVENRLQTFNDNSIYNRTDLSQTSDDSQANIDSQNNNNGQDSKSPSKVYNTTNGHSSQSSEAKKT
ncbi:hypothetical protein F5Y03DRAFT_403215 [Xylaria venustula]|nr:hypothetical protein F5Y03DRAFT_403215 [Xylaria venustula]